MALHQFSLNGSILLVGGRNVSGGATDPFITLAYAEDEAYEVVPGTGNFIERVGKSTAQRQLATVTIHMRESAPDNEYFRSLVQLDQTSNGGVRDLLFKAGTRTISIPEGFFQGIPETTYGDSGAQLDWVFVGLVEDQRIGDLP